MHNFCIDGVLKTTKPGASATLNSLASGTFRYFIDLGSGAQEAPSFTLNDFNTYRFDTSDSSNTGHVIPLITNTDFVQADAEVYMPRHDLLTLNQAGEIVHVKGVSNLDPKFPELPDRSLELYQMTAFRYYCKFSRP